MSAFPKGLKVLLIDDGPEVCSTQATLELELGYAVTTCASGSAALGHARKAVSSFDVVLAESRLVAPDEAVGRSFIDAFEDTPVVLMAAGAGTADVLRAVRLGAVDFLDKPLSPLKLKNIWQHSVRKMMLKAAGPRACSGACGAAPPAPALPPVAAPAPALQQPGCQPATSAPALSAWAAAAAQAGQASQLASAPSLSVAPESPGTPATSADLPETFSMCSTGDDASAGNSLRASFDAGESGAPGALPRPSSFTSLPSSAAPLAGGGPAPAVWPALAPGCVWGTPAAGPVAPPLPAAAAPESAPATPAWAPSPMVLPEPPAAPTLIKCGGAAPAAAPLPPPPAAPLCQSGALGAEGPLLPCLSLGAKSAPGPLGLRLKKSASLLNMINAALAADAAAGAAPMDVAGATPLEAAAVPLPGCAPGMGLAPMSVC